MKRYTSIISLFFKNNFMSQLEYRFEFISWTIVSALWIFLTLAIVNLVFGQVSLVAGWTRDQVLIVVAVSGIFTSILWMFVIPSLLDLSEKVRKGSLDFYLTKPINMRFLISTSKYDMDNILRVIVLTYYLLFVIGLVDYAIPFISLLAFFTMCVMGLIIFYNFFFIMATTSFWLIDITNLEDLYANLLSIGRYPVYIFEGALKVVFTIIVPVAFIATFPVEFLIGKGNFNLLIIGFILVIISSLASHKFWNFALKRYSSASS